MLDRDLKFPAEMMEVPAGYALLVSQGYEALVKQ
jgi:hypothetical protein